MSFLRRSYPNQLINYTGSDLPDALDLITARLTTPTPADGLQLNRRRRRHHPWKNLDLEAFCRQQLMATHDAVSSPDRDLGGLTEFWRKRRKNDRRRRRRRRITGSRSTAGARVRRSAGLETAGGDTPRTLERGNEDYDGGRSSTFAVTDPPHSADGGHSSILAVATESSPTADSAAADVREERTDEVYNATDTDPYFRTAHALHYASIVILGLFVLQVQLLFLYSKHLYIQCPTAVQFKSINRQSYDKTLFVMSCFLSYFVCIFFDNCHAMLCISAAYDVAYRLSLRLSVTFVYSVQTTNKHIFKFFHHLEATPF